MNEDDKTNSNPRDSLVLKLPESEISSEEPWRDDVLNREEIAGRLTNLIQDQSTPFVISIHGQWGTGKTFLLKRWQKELKTKGFRAIYFNAWEDDFCDDPLLALLGQLSEHFKDSGLEKIARQVAETAMPLIQQNALGILNKVTGITLTTESTQRARRDFLKDYFDQRAAKDELKRHLAKMSEKVSMETKHPMVFIIDELDRCRFRHLPLSFWNGSSTFSTFPISCSSLA